MKTNQQAEIDHYKNLSANERMFKEAYEERNKVLEAQNFLLIVGWVITIAVFVGVILFG